MEICIQHVCLHVRVNNQQIKSNINTDATQTINAFGSTKSTASDDDILHMHNAKERGSSTCNKMILSDVSATIKPGRLVALMGGSGSGKVKPFKVKC